MTIQDALSDGFALSISQSCQATHEAQDLDGEPAQSVAIFLLPLCFHSFQYLSIQLILSF